MSVLVLAEHDLGRLSPATARIVAGAAQLGPVDLLVAGHEVSAVAEQAATLAGVIRVLVADQPELNVPASDVLAPLLETLAPRYTHIVAASAAIGRDVMPRLAARLDVMPVTDVVEILSPERFMRPIHAGNALETVLSPQSPNLLTLRASAFAPATSQAPAPIDNLDSPPIESAVRLIAEHRTENSLADLATARIVVAGGVSVGSKQGFALVENLAAVLGAAVGATRAAVDAGYAPNDWQIGQTGKIIAPDLYIAIGISGALQHLAGIQGARTILAINTDPEAPLVKIADLVLVGDLFALVPELIAELDRRGLKR